MRLITSPMTAVAVLVVSVALLVACGGGDDSEADAATATPTAQPTSAKGELIPTATPFASRPTPTIVSDGGGNSGNSGTGSQGNSGGGGGGGGNTGSTPTATPASTSSTHVVVEGDTLSAIADQYGTTVEAIMEENDISDASLIFVGQELTIPAAATSGGDAATPDAESRTHVVAEGDTLSAIADQYGTTIEAISEANGLTNSVIFIGQELTIPEAAPAPDPTATPEATSESGPATYTVKDGDTATGIAEAFGVTLQALADANEVTIAELNNIFVGQELNIPVADE